PAAGALIRLDALDVGLAAWRLGAGRARQGDPVQAGAGVEMHAKPGDSIAAGQPLFTLHTDTPEAFPVALDLLRGAFTIDGTVQLPPQPLILDRITA
ncbi:thymidine phosphorylase, partial [Nocardia sp. NPDC004582]